MSEPHLSVEVAVLEGFAEVLGGDVFGAVKVHRGDLGVDIDGVQKRSGNLGQIVPHLSRGAVTVLLGMSQQSARTPVRSDYKTIHFLAFHWERL